MAYSKVTFNGTTIMDVTSDTVAANNLLTGETATKADGTKVTGTYSPTVKHTATIIKKGYDYDRASRWSQIRYKGTRYYLLGSTFEFEAGETATVYLGIYPSGQITINVNGVAVVDTTGSGYQYSYTLPDADISIELGDAAAPETINIYEKTPVMVKPLTATANGVYSEADVAYSPVTVNVSGGGSSEASKKQVKFIDYDGTLLYSYTKEEANALQVLPSNPSHAGLVAQGWNWSLADIKAQLTAQPDADVWVGQMYITQSGDTEIDVSMPAGRLNPILTVCVNGTITVDWGDNTTPDTVTGTSSMTRLAVSHSYTSAGDYTISIHPVSGNYAFYNTSSYLILRKDTVANSSRVYSNCIQKIRLGEGITSIGAYAFQYCSSLASITIPDSITSIGSNAFGYCYSLASIIIPDGVTRINSSVFNNSYSLTSIAIPDGATIIDASAFNNCYLLTSITIPDGVTSIGTNAFQNCYSLTSIAIPDGVTSIGGSAFNNCYSLTSITIPDGVTSINSSVFNNCYSLASITIPHSVTSIGSNAFTGCNSLTSITIPDSVTSIGSSAFSSCYSLTSITIPDGVTSISAYAFQYCSSLTSITISDSVTSIGNYAFAYCSSLTSIPIPDSVTSIGTYVFAYCSSLTSITIPDGVTSIGTYAFQYCSSLTSITIPDSVTSIDTNAFNNCHSLTSITIPDGVTSIGTGVFSSCYSLVSITIPDSATSIGGSAFSYCYSLASIAIPDGVTSISANAFGYCYGMAEYHILPTTPPTLGTTAFYNIQSDCKIYVPSASLADYQAATNWSAYASYMVGE